MGTCVDPENAMIHFWVDFCGSDVGKRICYPQNAESYLYGNALLSSPSGKLAVQSDAGTLPHAQSDAHKNWATYIGYNCYGGVNGHGGTADDPEDRAWTGRSLGECKA